MFGSFQPMKNQVVHVKVGFRVHGDISLVKLYARCSIRFEQSRLRCDDMKVYETLLPTRYISVPT